MRQRLPEAQRREQILRATIEVVATSGFDAASASAIAAHAGLSKGLIWHYFADKVELMRAAVRQAVGSLVADVVAGVDEEASVADRVRAYVRAVAAAHQAHPDDFRAMNRITSKLAQADGAPAFSVHDYEPLFQGQQEMFRSGQLSGELRDFDTRVMAVTYQSSIDGMLAYLDAHPEADGMGFADSLADVLIAAMLQPGG